MFDFALSALVVLCCVVQSLLPASADKMIDVYTDQKERGGEDPTPTDN